MTPRGRPGETPRQRLHLEILSHLTDLSPREAGIWLDRQGPPSGARSREHGLSPPLRRLLQRRRQQILAANLHRIGRFQELVDELARAGIPVCPLKGIHLLGTVYGEDPESRPMADLDLLVRPEDADGAVDRLRAALGLGETSLSRRLAARSHERVLTGSALVVEIHTRLGLRTGRACAWNDLAPAPGRLHEREVHLLDRETTLAHLVVHFVQHGPWSSLRWVEDVLRWSERGFDAERTRDRARRLGCRRSLVAGTRALRNRLGPEVLPGLPDRDRVLGRSTLFLYERLAGGPVGASPVPGLAAMKGARGRRHLGTVLLADRPGDLIPFLWNRSRQAFQKCSAQATAVRKTSPRATSE